MKDEKIPILERVYVEESCLELEYTREILSRLPPAVPVHSLADRGLPPEAAVPYPLSLNQGKRQLFLCRNRGKFFKPCPATREYRCCDYQVLNIGMNCPMDCVYCILQAYLNNPWLSFFVNIDEMFKEMREAFSRQPERFFRIGTGEFTDSMALDRLTGLSRRLIEFMRDQDQAVLELKSKAVVIEQLQDLDHGGRTITAWSLNSPAIMAREEFRTASLEQRLAAAARCSDWGYRLAFHFDPVIYHPGWREGYRDTIARLFSSVPNERIAWISVGCLRFLPALRAIAAARFPRSVFFNEEFVPGLDGKFRYFRGLRVEMYQFIVNELQRQAAPDTCIYLCMESDEIWREVFGFSPEERGGLPAMLDRAARI